ncbi:MAG: superoxide dismutase family protein [Cyanobacteria bacterium]|jgi:Cu-Zn family superoxide dismutase|nr:superoxide dismutase family protein [Cyanobacteria bacterium GSL.Bin1]
MQFSKKIKQLIGLTVLSTVVVIATSAVASPFSPSILGNFFPSLHSSNSTQIGYASIQGTSNHPELSGKILLHETSAGLRLIGMLKNVPPGAHGFHIHEFGSCADDGQAAGGHYNPDGVKHGNLLTDGFEGAHAGDLGNVVASNGTASWKETFPGLSLSSGNYPVVGRAVILHADPDDFGQPTGNAGARIGCGTITLRPASLEQTK